MILKSAVETRRTGSVQGDTPAHFVQEFLFPAGGFFIHLTLSFLAPRTPRSPRFNSGIEKIIIDTCRVVACDAPLER